MAPPSSCSVTPPARQQGRQRGEAQARGPGPDHHGADVGQAEDGLVGKHRGQRGDRVNQGDGDEPAGDEVHHDVEQVGRRLGPPEAAAAGLGPGRPAQLGDESCEGEVEEPEGGGGDDAPDEQHGTGHRGLGDGQEAHHQRTAGQADLAQGD